MLPLQAAIANDQRVIGELMKNPTSSSFEVAKNVYEEGGSSRPSRWNLWIF